jgi:NAD(P)-dependent dehydrogenase (short-subunit alcohol dehydrogenase family)
MAEDLVYRAAEAMEKPLDILINNASQYGHGSARTTSANTWDDFQNVNLRAPFIMAQTLHEMLGDDGRGDVINLNDFRSLRAAADDFAYNMSKWGLHGLTRNLALALAPRLRVNELALGAVLPPSKGSGDYKHTTKDEIPIGRFVTPAEVCSAMLFLLANEAMTGQILNLDGGQNLNC